jgi:hypothetical protein
VQAIKGMATSRDSIELHATLYFPLRRECRMLSAALYARVRLHTLLHTRPRVQRAPGIPCALFIPARLIFEHLGRIAPRDRGVVFSASHVIAGGAKQSIVTYGAR